MNMPLHSLSVKQGIKTVEDILNDYCEADYDKYRRFLRELKLLVDECASGHGVS